MLLHNELISLCVMPTPPTMLTAAQRGVERVKIYQQSLKILSGVRMYKRTYSGTTPFGTASLVKWPHIKRIVLYSLCN